MRCIDHLPGRVVVVRLRRGRERRVVEARLRHHAGPLPRPHLLPVGVVLDPAIPAVPVPRAAGWPIRTLAAAGEESSILPLPECLESSGVEFLKLVDNQ